MIRDFPASHVWLEKKMATLPPALSHQENASGYPPLGSGNASWLECSVALPRQITPSASACRCCRQMPWMPETILTDIHVISSKVTMDLYNVYMIVRTYAMSHVVVLGATGSGPVGKQHVYITIWYCNAVYGSLPRLLKEKKNNYIGFVTTFITAIILTIQFNYPYYHFTLLASTAFRKVSNQRRCHQSHHDYTLMFPIFMIVILDLFTDPFLLQ